MIVTCSNCSKRYMLDDILLPKEGRQVRCVSCQHVWRLMPEMSSFSSPPPFLELPHTDVNETHFSKKQSRWIWWVLFFAFLLSLLSGLIFGRNKIVSYWPESERIYALLGLQASLPGTGLAISNATSLINQDGPTEMIVVMGDILNSSPQVRPIPPLKIKLVRDNKEAQVVLDYWEHRLSENSLLPGEQIHFETAPRPKIEGAEYVVVDF